MSCRLPEHEGTWSTAGIPVDCQCDGNGNFSSVTGEEMETQVSYSAVVVIEGSAKVHLHTLFYGGYWRWSGCYINVVAHDQYGCQVMEDCGLVDSGTTYFDNSEDAIVHAVAQFDGTEGVAPSFGLGSADNIVEVGDDYPGDVLPTGWDAADHKAMYE